MTNLSYVVSAILCLSLGTAAVGQLPVHPNVREPPPGITETLTERMQIQADAWNRGDIDAFMEVYWNSPKLSFSSGGKTTYGWEETRDRYKNRYATPEKMGQLSFSGLEVSRLGPDAAMVLGKWKLTRKSDAPNGNFTLVFRRVNRVWFIVHDHTSLLPDEETK